MSAVRTDDQPGGEALQAAQYARRGPPTLRSGAASGSAQITSVVLPFLQKSKNQLPSEGNYSPPHRAVFMLSNQQLTPILSRCRVGSNCERDTSHAASREAVLVVSSGTLLA